MSPYYPDLGIWNEINIYGMPRMLTKTTFLFVGGIPPGFIEV
jgi:hypothetical protein